MNAYTEPPRVSDEDWAKAVKAVAVMLAWGDENETLRRMGDARAVVGGLVSHGWRPQSVIYCETILDHVSTPEAATSLIDVLRRNGIEVRH